MWLSSIYYYYVLNKKKKEVRTNYQRKINMQKIGFVVSLKCWAMTLHHTPIWLGDQVKFGL